MKILICVFFLVATLVGCMKSAWSAFAFQPDKTDAELGINQHRKGFFILRYSAYRGSHRLGGTLNEISLRNLSGEPMKVESLALVQMFRGRQVTKDSAPIPYDGLNGSIVSGNKPTIRKDIAPDEWMSFDFPTKDILEFNEGDKMYLTLSVSLTAGAQHFEKKIEFTKTLMKSQLPSL
jgi:hypothetical protein